MTTVAVLLTLAFPGLWQQIRPGVSVLEVPMAEHGPLSVVRVVALRLEPRLVRFRLDSATRNYGTRGAWTVARLPANGIAAVNTGQFIGGVPWGWIVYEGVESSPPGMGALAMSFVVDSNERAALLTPHEVAGARGHVRLALQSYPALLVGNGEVPWELQAGDRGVDLYHRDSRLALCTLADGSVVLGLTRFHGLGAQAETFPWGPTVVEMAAFMKRLGCRRAVMLDGGISSQMAVQA